MESDKICGTNLTIGELERNINKHFNTHSSITAYEAEDINGGKKGMLSIMAKVHKMVWSPAENKLPSSVVIKLTSGHLFKALQGDKEGIIKSDDLMGMWAQVFQDSLDLVHNSEVAAYKWLGNRPEIVSMAKCYGIARMDLSTPEKAAFIIEEDLSVKGGHASSFFEVVMTVESVKQIIGDVARVQAYSLNNPEILKDPDFKTSFETIFPNETMLKLWQKQYMDSLRDNDVVKDYFGPELIEAALSEKMQLSYDQFLYANRQLHLDDGLPTVLVHGDLHSHNVLLEQIDKKTCGKPLALVDWQLCHPGSPVEDVVRILLFSTHVQDKNDRLDEILQHYLDTFNGALPKPRMTFEMVKQAYERRYYQSLLMSVAFCGSLVAKYADNPVLKEQVLRNFKGVVEDAVEFEEKHGPLPEL